jgi:hypothetical protein
MKSETALVADLDDGSSPTAPRATSPTTASGSEPRSTPRTPDEQALLDGLISSGDDPAWVEQNAERILFEARALGYL